MRRNTEGQELYTVTTTAGIPYQVRAESPEHAERMVERQSGDQAVSTTVSP